MHGESVRFDCNDIPDYWKWNTGAEMMLDWPIPRHQSFPDRNLSRDGIWSFGLAMKWFLSRVQVWLFSTA